MKCGDNEQCCYSKVLWKNRKQEQSKYEPLQKLETGSGAAEE